jgi:serine protease
VVDQAAPSERTLKEEKAERGGSARRRSLAYRRADRDPSYPPDHVLAEVDGRVLDPGTALTVDGIVPRSTVYVGPRLVISADRDRDEVLGLLRDAARPLGWRIDLDRSYPESRVQGRTTGGRALGLSRCIIRVESTGAALAPDGWVLLQQARGAHGKSALRGVGLDHVLFVAPRPKRPFHESNPVPSATEFLGVPVDSYGMPGYGGRQPVAYVGPPPYRRPDSDFVTRRRPVVGILDTGCGEHEWLDDIVDTSVGLKVGDTTLDIGYTDPASDPEVGGDYVGPLDGGIDELAGHGTFIAGLVHQACPDADIVAWRAVNSSGPIVESDWTDALARIVELVRRHAEGEPDGMPIDVLNLSSGYYHETPGDAELYDPTIRSLLETLGRCGTVVVCSAGNDATARPLYPAAFAPWDDAPAGPPADALPVLSVGAHNPNATVALFSNTGPWVRCYEPGAAVLSTVPKFQGGLQPGARTTAYRLIRESIDLDDFTSGFALWSGTSFAAPMLAGKVAAALVDTMPAPGTAEERAAAVARGWSAVEQVSPVRPQ